MALVALSACCNKEQSFDYTVDKFYDLEILRYQVPEFDSLSLQQKTLVYHLTEAALHGRDILFDQNGRYNLRIRRALEALYTQYKGDKTSAEFISFEKYLKRVWFANGIHHHYASDKFQPEFSQEWFVAACAEAGVTYDEAILPVIFDPTVMPKSLSLEGEDLLLASANNYYEGVTQAEAEAYYEAHKDNSAEPLWIGLNSKLVKEKAAIDKHQTAPGEAIVDLHIGELVDNILGMSSNDIFRTQINYFKKMLESAITNEYDKVTFIHGVGNGVLKNAIIEELKH